MSSAIDIVETLTRELAAAQEQIAALSKTVIRQEKQIATQLRDMKALRAALLQQAEELKALLTKLKRIKIPPQDDDQPDLFGDMTAVLEQAQAALADDLANSDDEDAASCKDPEATVETAPASDSKPKKPRQPYAEPHPGRQKLPAHLERKIIYHDLPSNEKIDPATGKPYRIIHYEDTERLETHPTA